MKKLGVILLIIIFVIVLAKVMINIRINSSKEFNVYQTDDILISEIYQTNWYFGGIAENISQNEFETVSIKITQFDSEGNTLGFYTDHVSNLEPGETWEFKITKYKEMTRYEIEINTY